VKRTTEDLRIYDLHREVLSPTSRALGSSLNRNPALKRRAIFISSASRTIKPGTQTLGKAC